MNKTTVALTVEQYKEIIGTMRTGFTGCRPNNRIATALMLEANLGLRISDILRLHLDDIIKDGDRYRLDITEQKTGKVRNFTVPIALYQFIRLYCLENSIAPADRIFPITERAVQKQLKRVCDYLDIAGAEPTHSVNSMPRRSTGTVGTILSWSSTSFSIPRRLSHRSTSASSRRRSRRRSKTT